MEKTYCKVGDIATITISDDIVLRFTAPVTVNYQKGGYTLVQFDNNNTGDGYQEKIIEELELPPDITGITEKIYKDYAIDTVLFNSTIYDENTNLFRIVLERKDGSIVYARDVDNEYRLLPPYYEAFGWIYGYGIKYSYPFLDIKGSGENENYTFYDDVTYKVDCGQNSCPEGFVKVSSKQNPKGYICLPFIETLQGLNKVQGNLNNGY